MKAIKEYFDRDILGFEEVLAEVVEEVSGEGYVEGLNGEEEDHIPFHAFAIEDFVKCNAVY